MKKFLIVLTVVAMASFLLVGCFGTTPVTVTGVTLDQTTLDLTAGGATGTLVATVAPADASNTSVNWTSSAEAVATVAGGVVTPVAEGTADITVTTVDGDFTAICVVTVSAVEPAPVIGLTGIAVLPKTMDLVVGGSDTITSVTATYEIKGIPVPIALGDCTYTSSPTGIITVDDGVVTAVTPGIATITVTYGGESDTLVVTVSAVPITAIAAITGTPQVGVKLTAGALTPTAATATYQWQICDTSGGTYVNITGAIEKTYTPVAGDVTKFIKVVATGTGNYSGTKTSVATTAVAAEDTSVAAVATVRNAAVALNYLSDFATADDVTAFIEALKDTNFEGYVDANGAAYVAAVANFTTVTTVADVNDAIAAVNTAEVTAATAAVATAEGSNLQADVDAAQLLVTALPADVAPATTKADLQGRIDVVQGIIDAAVAAVNAATTSVALNAALANAAFTDYDPANYDAYFASAEFTGLLADVAAVDDAILAVNAADAVAAVRYAAIALQAGMTGDVTAFLEALANDAFTDYVAANYDAYFASAGFTGSLADVAAVNAAITTVNNTEAVAAVNAATTSVTLNAALANDAFTDYYVAANYDEYFAATATLIDPVFATVAAVNAAITTVNNTDAVAAVRNAAIELDSSGITAPRVAALSDALANAAFAGYDAANSSAYANAAASFTAVTTVAEVNAAITAANPA